MFKILFLGISILSKCQFLSAHAQLVSDSRSNSEVTFDMYEIFGDLYELKYENRMLVEKVETLEGQISDQAEKIEVLEGIADEGKSMADKFEHLERRLNDQAETIEQLKGKMVDQEEQIDNLEGVIKSQKTSFTEQAEAIEIFENKLEVIESRVKARHAFQVLRSKSVTYQGYDFLALEVRVPTDGLSRSSNWCYDYQYLCGEFNRRPTGCGGRFWTSSSAYSSCRDKYNSDMNNGDVLSCNPSNGVVAVANLAFPNLSPPAQYGENAFGFHRCDSNYCSKTLQGSNSALTYVHGFCQSNMTTMYTVCR